LTHEHTNRLSQETSPYLLQHQHNPVDWYSWGPEAFEAARTQNKPIFLSVGYSTCYWCHVMERECFEKEAVAAVMNAHCINIKVDREERPDVDQLYMLAVQVLTRHGGWPMSVFLTPDLRPFYGGTYFPAQDSHGRPGFVTLVKAIDNAFHNKRDEVDRSADELSRILRQISEPAKPDRAMVIDEAFVTRLIEQSADDYDSAYGGFGGAPKFPRETLLELLLTYCSAGAEDDKKTKRMLEMVLHTLDAMAAGGIRDQLGGGFHRYSTDAQWLVPHFEIMLYDNAMLAWCYAEAYRQTKDRKYEKVARGILDFVLREMTSPDGAFYTAFDAEVDAQEGLSYLWTAEEIEALLGRADAEVFNRAYGVNLGPNFADPHHGTGTPDKNILYQPREIEEGDDAKLSPLREKLYQARLKRKQPLLDTKILTSWNALAIRAFAYVGKVLEEPRYIDAAARGAEFLLRQHRMPDGGLYRTSRDGKEKYAAFLDDYSFLVQALLVLRDATGEKKWGDEAAAVSALMVEKFGDAQRGGFYFTDTNAQDLFIRQKTASDSPLPSGNAVAALAMLELGQPDVTRQTISGFARQLRDQSDGLSALVQAALLYVRQHGAIEVSGDSAERTTPTPQEVASELVKVRPSFVSPTQLNFEIDILEPFHINAHNVAGGLVGTSLTSGGVSEIESVDYPPGEERRFAFADETLRVYSGTVTIALRFKQEFQVGTELNLRLTYQACDDTRCLPPVTQNLTLRTG
jgi:uncharacterized protein YyaL (SSP411 family)